MPDFLFVRCTIRILACVIALGIAGGDALAQGVNPICPRLEAQLASIDRGGVDPGRAGQIRRYEEAAGRQQAELERVSAQATRMGCDSSGFFQLFNAQSAQCGPITHQIQRMRTNLQQITTNLERLRAGSGAGPERDSQRRSVLIALAQNNCGPQYAAAAQNQGSFFDDLFGNHSSNQTILPPVDSGAQSGTYRTVCVRSCDGFYFPISFATTPSRFSDDERTCKNLCPATEAALYAYRNPGEDMNQAVSTSGQPYSSSPNAFRYRQEFNPSCSCKAAGQTWAEALKGLDDKAAAAQQGDIIVTEDGALKGLDDKAAAAQQGDIIVTEDGARKMSQPAHDKGSQKKDPASTADAPENRGASSSPASMPPAAPTPSNKPIRSVGPTFIPAQ